MRTRLTPAPAPRPGKEARVLAISPRKDELAGQDTIRETAVARFGPTRTHSLLNEAAMLGADITIDGEDAHAKENICVQTFAI